MPMRAAVLDLRRISFPVVGTNRETGEAVKPLVYGTAFCIGDSVFLTAGHVIQNVQSDGGTVTLLDLTDERGAMPRDAEDTEVIEGCDLGVISCDMPAIGILE